MTNYLFCCVIKQTNRCFHLTAFLCRRLQPLGPMPNEEIDVRNLESVEKYRSYTRYLRQAEEAKNKPAWWKTYRSYVEQADPEHGETKGGKLLLTVILWRCETCWPTILIIVETF